MEYVLAHRGGRGQSFEYELLYDGDTDKNNCHAMGLLDITLLKTTKNKSTMKSLGGKDNNVGVPLGDHWGTFGHAEKSLEPSRYNGSGKSVGGKPENALQAL